MEGIDSVFQPGEESEEIKTRRAPSSPREAWGKTGGLSCSSKPGQALAACVPASGMATGQNHQHAHLRLPGTARTASQSPPRPGPPRYLLPRYPLAAALRPGFASPPPNFGTFRCLTHVGHRPLRVLGRKVPGPLGEECARRGSSPLDGEEERSPLQYRTHPGRPPSWY